MIPELAMPRALRQDDFVSSFVQDINEADFQVAVIERSKELPVLVDFWAPWCGPCRTLGPLLEKAVGATAGRVVLVKIDTDANPGIAAQFGIQGIPAVKAFRDGQVIDEFSGALPAPAIAACIARVVPSAAAEGLGSALQKLGAGDRAGAEAGLRSLLGDDEAGSAAAFHLAHMLIESGGTAAAVRELAEKVHPSANEYVRVEMLQTLADFIERATPAESDEVERRVAENPKDHDARLSIAANFLVRGHVEPSLDALLESVSRNPKHADGAGQKAILAIFDHLEEPPAQPELVRDYRRRLQIVS